MGIINVHYFVVTVIRVPVSGGTEGLFICTVLSPLPCMIDIEEKGERKLHGIGSDWIN